MTITVIDITMFIFVFVFGSVIGSFLNVVILRTPLHQSIITEPSHCFSCGHRLAWYDMFPVFSWLFLRGKCRYCKAKISPRYMIFEALCGASYLAAYIFFVFIPQTPDWWALGFSAVMFAVLIVLSGIDIDHFEIPYWCSITIAVLGVASFFVFDNIPWYERLISFGVVLVMFVILVLVGGMGGGDMQLMSAASLLLGYRAFLAILFGMIAGSVYGIVKKVHDREAEKEVSEKLKGIVTDWYQDQLDRDSGYVKQGCEDVIVGSISDGQPDIEWEFLDEDAWHGLPDKSALSKIVRENITDEREGGFRIIIKEDLVTKVKYSRRMVFGPFLALGISIAWLIGTQLIEWYSKFF